jgi:hypothetical protein
MNKKKIEIGISEKADFACFRSINRAMKNRKSIRVNHFNPLIMCFE